MSSCIYDDIEVEESDNSILRDGYSLALTIDLPVMDTRADGDNDWEKYEDYVKDFSLLFFKVPQQNDEDVAPEYQTLMKKYDSGNLSFFEVDKGAYGYTKQWYVRIPIAPEDSFFVKAIRENDFKIAVLANWPVSVTMKEENFIKNEAGDNINTLHRLAEDAIYKAHSVYGFLTDEEGRMGATTDWLEKSFKTKADAREWIQTGEPFLPGNTASNPSQPDDYKYKPWLRWNFEEGSQTFLKPQVTGPITEETEGVFSFMAYASGTLFITAKAVDGAAMITAQVGNAGTGLSYEFGPGATTIEHVISITGNEQRVYIYNSGESSVEISQIEYIQDEYLYETDRTGVELSEEHLIPMYGVQKFGKLENYWVEGTVFDLSNFNKLNPTGYEGGIIQLLRSVAKVELLLPKEAKFSHVFLRNMNRTAFCEPMDVASSTIDIWNDTNSSSSHWNDNCEWSKLIGLDPFYTGSEENGHSWDNYQDKLSWYYGNWDKYEGGSSLDKNKNFETGDYPHILNPHIDRSEFVKFLQAGDDNEYDRYVLYVPEKFVDDPDFTTGEDWGSTAPKLCHIEFRGADDPYYNLDDNNCYRIYFTEGGVYGNAPTLDDENHLWENTYENDPEILKNHWTIMRNHIYTFKVSYKPSANLAVQVRVLPWKRREVEVNW